MTDPLFEPLRKIGVDEAGIRRLFKQFSRGTIQRWVRITDAAMHEKPKGFPGFKVSPAAFLIDGIQNNRTPPDWLYAHDKKQERDQWARNRAAFDETERTWRKQYDQARVAAFETFRRSAEGRSIFDKTYPILLAFHKQTDPHRAHAAAEHATLARMERENFAFPEFATWMLKREEGSDAARS